MIPERRLSGASFPAHRWWEGLSFAPHWEQKLASKCKNEKYICYEGSTENVQDTDRGAPRGPGVRRPRSAGTCRSGAGDWPRSQPPGERCAAAWPPCASKAGAGWRTVSSQAEAGSPVQSSGHARRKLMSGRPSRSHPAPPAKTSLHAKRSHVLLREPTSESPGLMTALLE